MGQKNGKRLIAMLLSVAMVIMLLPARVVTVQAASSVAEGEFNPNTGDLTYIFGFNVTQYVNIEVLVREVDKPATEVSLGLIAEEVTAYGTAEIKPKKPEDSSLEGPVPGHEATNAFYSDGASLTKGEYYTKDDGTKMCQNIFVWDGRINGIPILGPDPTQDEFEVVLVCHAMGDVTKGCTPCTEDDDGHEHGENYIWTQNDTDASNPRTVILVDYRTFLNAMLNEDGELLSMIQLMHEGSISADVLQQMLEDYLADNGAPQYLKEALIVNLLEKAKCGDPVDMATGAFISTYKDMRLEGGVPLTFLRAYNSRYEKGSLGKGFTHGYEYSLHEDRGIVRVTVPGGEEVIFLRLREGGYDALQSSVYQLEEDGTGYVMTHQSKVQFFFDAEGLLTEIVNPSGITVAAFDYDADGQLTDIDGVAGSFSLTWKNGHIARVTDSAGRNTVYDYNGDTLISVTNCDGDTQIFDYDENDFLSSVTDFEGEEYIRNTYDELGRVTRQKFINAGQELTADFTYSEQDEEDGSYTVTAVDFYGYERTYCYDKHRELLQIIEADGTTTGGYEKIVATSVTDKLGNATKYDVDDLGYITAIHYADGGSIQIAYDDKHLPIQVTDQMGESEYYTYTGGSIAAYTDKNGNITRFTYNSLGLLASEKDAQGNVTSYKYDGNGHMTEIAYPDGGQTSYKNQ